MSMEDEIYNIKFRFNCLIVMQISLLLLVGTLWDYRIKIPSENGVRASPIFIYLLIYNGGYTNQYYLF